ncbi:MAG: YtpI family protein, partial [Lysinibacillus sp.]
MLNLIFVFAIIVSFVCYFYYKTKQIRSTLPIAKKWYTNKAGVALGIFILIFGLNQAYLFP